MLAKRILKELNDWKNDPINNCWLKELEFDKWEATFIGPESSPYAGFLFNVSIQFPKDYPFKPPKMKLLTSILHPNIDKNGQIDLEILNYQWSPALSIKKVMLSILDLLLNPDFDNFSVLEAYQLYKKSKQEFFDTARQYAIDNQERED